MKSIKTLWKQYLNLLKPLLNTKKRTALLVATLMVLFSGFVVVQAVARLNTHNRAVILFAGDSNIELGAGEINSKLSNFPNHYANSYVSIFVTHYGAGIRYPNCYDPYQPCTWNYWREKLTNTFKKVQPDAIVTNLGINDTRSAGTATTQGYANYGQKIDYFMGSIPKTKPVFWLSLPCQIEPASYKTACQSINQSLTAALNRWPNLTIINWGTVANSHPEYIISGDVHYTPAGYKAMADVIAQWLNTKFPMPN